MQIDYRCTVTKLVRLGEVVVNAFVIAAVSAAFSIPFFVLLIFGFSQPFPLDFILSGSALLGMAFAFACEVVYWVMSYVEKQKS
jgi:hypothetical protein